MRLAFVGGIYVFLFLVLRSTVRDLALIARGVRRAGAGPGQAVLVVLDAAGSTVPPGTVFPLEPDSLVGREAGMTVSVDDPHVSARHAGLTFQHGQWWLRDLGSSNGTLLNGQPVHSVVAMRSGDVLQCAAVRLRFVAPYVDSAESQVA
ncbi:MAG: FHA domain-containing protein [Thermomicrobiales bacterium]|nr:FHA domain-containing protein [Thermomicrobiales bacterium]MCA9878622.1 FHA domain-containing protein [Thermomicrobiales bacterium]